MRRLADEAADAGLLSPELAAGISRVKGVKQLGFRAGNWLSAEQCSEVLRSAFGTSMRAKRDYAMLAMLFGCGLRRSELVGLEMDEVQMRQGHWAVVDLIGKGGHIRTVPIPVWVKAALDDWAAAAGITEGRIFRAVARAGKVWGDGISQNVVWYVVKTCCEKAGLQHIAPHDLRRTCAKLCHTSGGEIEQIQFLLGHASVQTTERYLGCKQNPGHPVNDLFRLGNIDAATYVVLAGTAVLTVTLARISSTSRPHTSSFDTVISKCRLPDCRKAAGSRTASNPAPTRIPVAVAISHSSPSRFSSLLSSRLTFVRTVSESWPERKAFVEGLSTGRFWR